MGSYRFSILGFDQMYSSFEKQSVFYCGYFENYQAFCIHKLMLVLNCKRLNHHGLFVEQICMLSLKMHTFYEESLLYQSTDILTKL